jgi:hypothetical protein
LQTGGVCVANGVGLVAVAAGIFARQRRRTEHRIVFAGRFACKMFQLARARTQRSLTTVAESSQENVVLGGRTVSFHQFFGGLRRRTSENIHDVVLRDERQLAVLRCRLAELTAADHLVRLKPCLIKLETGKYTQHQQSKRGNCVNVNCNQTAYLRIEMHASLLVVSSHILLHQRVLVLQLLQHRYLVGIQSLLKYRLSNTINATRA